MAKQMTLQMTHTCQRCQGRFTPHKDSAAKFCSKACFQNHQLYGGPVPMRSLPEILSSAIELTNNGDSHAALAQVDAALDILEGS